MDKMYGYFYFRGKADESQHVRLMHREVIDLHSLFYHLGILSEKFSNSPTKRRFIDELFQNFSRYNNKLPHSVVVILDTIPDSQPEQDYIFIQGMYSHKIMRQIFSYLGYQIDDITTKTIVKRSPFFKKKEVSKWASYIAHR